MIKKKWFWTNIILMLISVIWAVIRESTRTTAIKSSVFERIITGLLIWIRDIPISLSNYNSGIYYLIFAISIISMIILALFSTVSLFMKKKEKTIENNIDKLVAECKEKIKMNKIEEAKNIYQNIKEISSKESYTREQYNKIIEIYNILKDKN